MQGTTEPSARPADRGVLDAGRRTVDLGALLLRAVRLHEGRRIEDAIRVYRQIIAVNPAAGEIYNNLATAMMDLNRMPEALATFRRAAIARPSYARPLIGVATILQGLGRYGATFAPYRAALSIEPDIAGVWFNFGIALQNAGLPEPAASCLRRTAMLLPDDPAVMSQHLFTLNYLERPGEALLAEHRAFEQRYAPPRPSGRFERRAGDADRKLRIGYVSVEFRTHLGANFLAPLFDRHDRRAFETHCYSMLEPWRADHHTAFFRSRADGWTEAGDLDDDALTARIRADGIDILVDLAGHTMRNRLPVFARRPAPVQLTWLGYANTTGLSSVDGRLVDEMTDPPGRSEDHASERLIRLPPPFLCFRPPGDAPDVVPLPAGRIGAVTFGSFNTLAKVSDGAVRLWADILRRAPEARLLIKDRALVCPDTVDRLRARFAGLGVDPDRVELVGWVENPAEHAGFYGRIDVALDPFPYNGTITTCEALWMGAPVVTLRGDRHAARVGASLCAAVGLPELIADTPERYVDIAVGLALDLNRLMDLRRGMRARLLASPLCDEERFVRNLESVYRTLWRRWREAAD